MDTIMNGLKKEPLCRPDSVFPKLFKAPFKFVVIYAPPKSAANAWIIKRDDLT